jgi:hypothetical protein
VFLMRNVHDDAPILMKSRWALSYLRGPLTGPEIARVMAPRKAAAAVVSTGANSTAAAPAPSAVQAAAPTPRPSVPAEVTEYFLPPTSGTGPLLYKPMVLGLAKLHFVDAKLGLDQWQTLSYLAPLDDDGKSVLWPEAQSSSDLKSRLVKNPTAEIGEFGNLPGPALRVASYSSFGKQLAAYLYENARAELLVSDALKTASAPGESEGDFRARLSLATREQRDAQVEQLRKKYAPKLEAIQEKMHRAEQNHEREKEQLSSQRLSTAVSIGTTVLGALFGRKAISAGNVGRAASAVRTASRMGKEKDDVERAEESIELLQQKLNALQQECDAEVTKLNSALDPTTLALRTVQVTPRKSDIAVGELALVWTPWRKGSDGFPAPAY